jgi:hypothetical protein
MFFVMSSLQKQLKVLEIDLSGYDLKVVFDGSKRFMGRSIASQISKKSENLLYNTNAAKEAFQKYLTGSRSYALLNSDVTLDAQGNSVGGKKISLKFGYSFDGDREVALNVISAGEPSEYGDVNSTNPTDLHKISAGSKIPYAEQPHDSIVIGTLYNFKPKARATGDRETVPDVQQITRARKVDDMLQDRVGILDDWVRVTTREYPRKLVASGPVVAPEYDIIPKMNFDLDLLEEMFVIAKFQRRVETAEVTRIAQAILDNEFFDIVFKVKNLSDKKRELYGIWDAQQRFHGLRAARDYGGLERYNLILLSPKGNHDIRQMYESFNIGKKLTPSDFTKSWYNKDIPFFGELGDDLDFYRQNTSMTYYEMARAHLYAKGKERDVPLMQLKKTITEMDTGDVAKIKMLVAALRIGAGMDRRDNPAYQSIVYRNLLKLSHEYPQIDRDGMIKVVRKVGENRKIAKLSKTWSMKNMPIAYDLILKAAQTVKAI